MSIIPPGSDQPSSDPLEIDKKKRKEMVKQCKDLLIEPVEYGALKNALEQHYVNEHNEHYTSEQLKDIVDQVVSDLTPEPEDVTPE